MKVTVERDELLTALHRVQGIVEKRHTMQNLANVLLEAKAEGLDVFATDLELGMRGLYRATVEEPGSITFSGKKLYEMLRLIKDPTIVITVAGDCQITVEAGRSLFKVIGLPGEDYPPLPTIEREGLVSLPGTGLQQLIKKTLFAVSDNDTRHVFNGLLVSVINTTGGPVIRLVGTDGHRLAMADQPLDLGSGKSLEQETEVIVPKKGAAEIYRLLEEGGEEPTIGLTKNMLIFRKSGLALTARVMEGKYPDYQRVVPKERKTKISVNRDEFQGALRRVSVLLENRTSAVRLTVSKKAITLFSTHPDMGEAKEDIPASYNGEEFSTGFNAHYLLEALGVIDSETVSLSMEAARLSPCVLREQDNPLFQTIVMPVKV